ncbi:Signal transduction histidine kinase [Fulvimarina manganoxydans]|uniref:histidine kinase n=1 Tax=Fulvimarina manganoxydans TaxID=937218 RepID=A0A1W2ATB5_9HYPH|nr:Signal transduction histidine kinase [Fulvimarina manganoxydans]
MTPDDATSATRDGTDRTSENAERRGPERRRRGLRRRLIGRWGGSIARSLAVRVVGLSSIWAAIALVAAGILISALYRQAAEDGFAALLEAQLYNLVNSVGIDDAGVLTGSPNLGDLQYMQPESGWYWEVLPASRDTRGRLSSPSLGYSAIPSEPLREVPFDVSYQRSYPMKGLAGEDLQVLETEVVLDDENRAARFRVMGNRSELAEDINAFDRQLAAYLGAVAAGTVIVNAAVILLGLRPLRTVRQSLARIRDGRAERLEGEFPTEIAPLAAEMNALIGNNRRIVERARTQVGNLAHSLKTPIAVLTNEADKLGGESGRLVGEQALAMRRQVQHYLDRARMAAQTESVVFRTPVAPVAERLVRVIGKLNPHLKVAFDTNEADDLIFSGERQDLEEILGNLLENAGKWARSEICLVMRPAGPERFEAIVEDDGPGLSEAERKLALKRGRRLDEKTPGSGLGLSIVSDLAQEYQGSLRLETARLGGLAAIVSLPRLNGVDALT